MKENRNTQRKTLLELGLDQLKLGPHANGRMFSEFLRVGTRARNRKVERPAPS